MKYLTIHHVLDIHAYQIRRFGGTPGVKSPGLLDSAVAQPFASFGGEDLYPTLAEKAAALGFSLVQNHPFHDGNKRTALAAMVMFLGRNGQRMIAKPEEQAEVIEHVAGREPRLNQIDLLAWVRSNTIGK